MPGTIDFSVLEPLDGLVLAGGADWQTSRPDGVTEVDALYSMKCDDGTVIISDYKTGKVLCDYTFNLKKVIYDEKGYMVKVGRHYTTPVKIDDLESNSWNYNFEFKG